MKFQLKSALAACLTVTLLLIQGCNRNSTNAMQEGEIPGKEITTIKVLQNPQWYVYTSQRLGSPIPQDIVTLDNGEEVAKFSEPKTVEKLKKFQAEGKIELNQVQPMQLINQQNLVYVADVQARSLNEAYILTSLINNWSHPQIKVLQSPPGRSHPRNATTGDVFELQDGSRYIVDYVGFEPIQDVIPAETKTIR